MVKPVNQAKYITGSPKIDRKSPTSNVPVLTNRQIPALNEIPQTSSGYQPKFPLRDFQKKAIDLIDKNQSVLVSAPTGSGKTVIAAAAMYRAIKKGKKLIFTAPIKALTNQKVSEFKEEIARMYKLDHADKVNRKQALEFANQAVGLITGDHYDVHKNTKAFIVTTEVLNLMLQGKFKGLQAKPSDIEDLSTIVHDEIHYLDDRDRGHVWEESIINTPAQTQIVGLSATMGNAEQIADWVSSISGKKMHLVKEPEENRPVKLKFHIFNQQVTKSTEVTAKTLDGKEILKVKNLDALKGIEAKEDELKTQKERLKTEDDEYEKKQLSIEIERKQDNLRMIGMVQMLQDHDKLPAIVFKFNQAACDNFTRAVAEAPNIKLLTSEEEQELDSLIEKALIDSPYLKNELESIELLKKGVAAHHAGHLPQFKSLVEKLYEKGLIKVCFATSTLAAGINMPARTTVLTELEKHPIGDLTISEFKQMAGRAGRPGHDTEGNVFVFANDNQQRKIQTMVDAQAEDIESRMRIDYQSFFNYYQDSDENNFNEFVSKSLLKYQELHDSGSQTKKVDLEKFTTQKMLTQFTKMKKFLKGLGYIEGNGKLSKKGEIASYFKFNNPVLLTEFLTDLSKNHKNELKRMKAENFVALVSLLSQDKGQLDFDKLNEFIEKIVEDNPNLGPFYASLTKNYQELLESETQSGLTDNHATLGYESFYTHFNWASEKLKQNSPDDIFTRVLGTGRPGKNLRNIKRTITLLKQIHKAASENPHDLNGLAKLSTKARESLEKDIVQDREYALAV